MGRPCLGEGRKEKKKEEEEDAGEERGGKEIEKKKRGMPRVQWGFGAFQLSKIKFLPQVF